MTFKVVASLSALLLACFITDRANAQTLNLEDALGDLDESVLTNLDPLALPSWQDLDQTQLQALCRELQDRFHGKYVVELAPLREVAAGLVPVLERDEQTRSYAAWLRTQLDYLAVADELRIDLAAPPLKLSTTAPANPTPELERHVWRERLSTETASAREQMYVSQLKPVFVSERVPAELVWIAEVESEFDPRARSPLGAAGLFQLMPGTAEILGLSLSPGDQRLDPERSARAAASYLKYLHDKFADWRLTLAAYNAGEGLVRRLLEKHEARTYDEIAQYLPAETQMYVPRVEATILRREGVMLEDLRAPQMGSR